jgi:hypothetical protein
MSEVSDDGLEEVLTLGLEGAMALVASVERKSRTHLWIL